MALSIGSEVRHYIHGHVGKICTEIPQYWGVYWYGGEQGEQHAEKVRKYGIPPYWQPKGIEPNNK